jgi:hypothetical protein
MINDEPLKVFKIEGDGKKGGNHQDCGDDVTDSKQPLKTAAIPPNRPYIKNKKNKRAL